MSLLRREERENLLQEYKLLHDSIYRRSATMQTINSILLPSSIVVIAIAIEFQESLDAIFYNMRVSGFLPLFSATLLFISFFSNLGIRKTNRICFDRIHEIEKTLGIKGHRLVYSKLQNTWWWKIRGILWTTLILLAMVVCIISSLFLFLR